MYGLPIDLQAGPWSYFRLIPSRTEICRPREFEFFNGIGQERSFNHPVGAPQQRPRGLEAKYLGALQVDDELESGRLLNPKVGGLGISRISRHAVREGLRTGRLVQVLPEYRCVYSTGELPGMWIIYLNRRLLLRTRVFVDALTQYLEKILT